MREQDLTRRSVLHGAAVLGAATLLVSQHSTPTVGMAEGSAPWGPGTVGKTGPGSAGGQGGATARGLNGLVGATVSPVAMRTQTWTEAAHRFDAIVRRPMAVTACRVYFKQAAIDRGGLYLARMMAASGVSAVISIRPSPNLRRSEITKLQRSIRQCRAAGLKIEAVSLWHEPNDITRSDQAFRTGPQYVDYVRYYGPAVVEMGIPLAYIPLVLTTNGALQDSYFPGTTWRGKPLVTHIYPDFYCVSQFIHGARMDASVRLADKYGLRLGIGEFGRTNCQHSPTDREFAAYMRYLRGIYAGRKDRASCMYWSDGPLNSPSPSAGAELCAFYDALT
jgi:hypothetical protein